AKARGRGRGRPRKRPEAEAPRCSEPEEAELPPRPQRAEPEVPKDAAKVPKDADAAPFGEPDMELDAETLAQRALQQKRLPDFVRCRKWPYILTPAWEGERWSRMLQDFEAKRLSEDQLLEEVLLKLRRQAAGEKIANSRLQRQKAAEAQEAARRAAKAARVSERPRPRPPQAPGCTCGRPIHTERCRLFRPRVQETSKAKVPKALEREPGRSWAEKEVFKLERHITQQPPCMRRMLWKRAMLRYHPDKHPESDGERLSEVFIEVKRRYDSYVFMRILRIFRMQATEQCYSRLEQQFPDVSQADLAEHLRFCTQQEAHQARRRLLLARWRQRKVLLERQKAKEVPCDQKEPLVQEEERSSVHKRRDRRFRNGGWRVTSRSGSEKRRRGGCWKPRRLGRRRSADATRSR
ncbi:unnamed protein product, partial [Effrenium voratum]